jgi:hypothetical protein
MDKEKKELLLRDLSARLTYKVIVDYSYNAFYVHNGNHVKHGSKRILTCDLLDVFMSPRQNEKGEYIKPYLRPMSSMTEEERIEFSKLLVKRYCEEDWEGHISTSYCIEIDNVYADDENGIKYPSSFSMDAIDWLNSHHFDYRNLIPKGLALEAPEGMYKTK